MIRIVTMILVALTFASCATKPPVQAMAEARAALQSIRPFYQGQTENDSTAYFYYRSAEESLLEATRAVDEKQYQLATQKANEAKRQARLAAKLKQNQ